MQKLFQRNSDRVKNGRDLSERTNIFTLKHLEIMPMYQFFFTI